MYGSEGGEGQQCLSSTRTPFFERPLFSNAEQVLRDILTLDPGNAEAQHNLAILQRKQQLLVGV